MSGVSTCDDTSQGNWTGHWREWHRGHGCDLDPNLDAAREAVAPCSSSEPVASPSRPSVIATEPEWSPAVDRLYRDRGTWGPSPLAAIAMDLRLRDLLVVGLLP